MHDQLTLPEQGQLCLFAEISSDLRGLEWRRSLAVFDRGKSLEVQRWRTLTRRCTTQLLPSHSLAIAAAVGSDRLPTSQLEVAATFSGGEGSRKLKSVAVEENLRNSVYNEATKAFATTQTPIHDHLLARRHTLSGGVESELPARSHTR